MKNLDVMLFKNWQFGGTAGYARYEFSESFTDENGIEWGSGPNSYLEVPTTISGNVVTIPAYLNFPETEAAIENNGVTVTCWLLDSRRKKKVALFEDARIYTSLDSPITLAQLVLANGASRLLRDTDVWTKEQVIDYVNTRPPAAKMTSLVYGIGRLDVPAADPADPIVTGINSPRLPPTPGAAGTGPVSNGSAYATTDIATQAELDAHTSDTTNVHGITDTSKLVVTSDTRLNKVENYASFAAALAAIGSTPTTLWVTSAVTVVTATVPATITLKFIRGGSLNVTTGQTLTILGGIEAGPYTIFTNIAAGQGTLSLEGNHQVNVLLGEWFGMTADGVTDNTPFMQAAIDCCDVAGGGFTIKLQRTWDSFYSFDGPKASGRPAIDFEFMEGITIEGANPGHIGGGTTGSLTRSAKTELRYNGTGTMPFIWGDCAANIILRNLSLRYTSKDFTGDFISWSATASNPVNGGPTYSGVSYGNLLEWCFVGGMGGTNPTYEQNAVNARMLLNLRGTVECGTKRCVFSIARRAIGGRVTSEVTSFTPKSGVGGPYSNNSGGSSSAFANSVTIHDTRFAFIRETTDDISGEGGYDICQPGTQWEITGCVFEPSSVDTGTPWVGRGITTEDTAVRANPNHIARGIVVSGCGFWDNVDGGVWVRMRGNGWVFQGNYVTIYNNGTTTDGQFIKLYGNSTAETRGLVVKGNTFTGSVTVSDKSKVYLDTTGITAGKVSNIDWENNGGDTEVVPPPPDIPYATKALTNFHFYFTTRTSDTLAISPYEGFILGDASAGSLTLKLPLAPVGGFTEYLKGRGIIIMKSDSSVNAVTVRGNAGTETIGGVDTTYSLTRRGQCALFVCVDGTNWMVAWESIRPALTGDDAVFMVPRVPTGGVGETTEAVSDTNNAVRAYRFTVTEPRRITKISFRIGTAGNLMGVGIYDSSGNKLASADSISISGGTTTYTASITALTLEAKASYFLAFAADTTTPTIGGTGSIASGFLDLLNKPSTGKTWVTCANPMSAGVLPSTLGALTGITSADSIPFFLLHN